MFGLLSSSSFGLSGCAGLAVVLALTFVSTFFSFSASVLGSGSSVVAGCAVGGCEDEVFGSS